jgi:hypothetical protein
MNTIEIEHRAISLPTSPRPWRCNGIPIAIVTAIVQLAIRPADEENGWWLSGHSTSFEYITVVLDIEGNSTVFNDTDYFYHERDDCGCAKSLKEIGDDWYSRVVKNKKEIDSGVLPMLSCENKHTMVVDAGIDSLPCPECGETMTLVTS